jgi:ribosomal protein S18 acetylase RimI-like enzyme
VVTQARAQGVAELRLYVEKDNKVAQSTYQALGLAGGHYEVFEQTLGQS